ncbi:MAG: transporter substrate-binding domain-containing protein [Solobacterium sp.]|nr:transporter substrate-binding domain-containing protein [Solobacterium sp.]MBR2726622.1 transporter substrate-binding domain-containing protein [Solobacterium sp.]
MKKIVNKAMACLLALSMIGCSNGTNEPETKKTELELVATLDQAILGLASGKCDAVALDGTTAQNYVNQSDGAFVMTGINFDLTMYGEHEGNVAAAKKGETEFMAAINKCIEKATTTFVDPAFPHTYYTTWVAIAKKQSGTEDEEAEKILADLGVPIWTDIPVDETYNYLVDTTDLEKPELDLSNPTGKLKEVLDKGTLVIATSPDYPAAEFITEDGVVYGNEMMLAKYIADCLGVDLVIETMDFNAVLTAVDTGKVDLALSGFGWKEDREEAFELSLGYIGDSSVSFHTLIVPAADADKYHSLEDFLGTHIMAQANSLQEMYVRDQILALEEGE